MDAFFLDADRLVYIADKVGDFAFAAELVVQVMPVGQDGGPQAVSGPTTVEVAAVVRGGPVDGGWVVVGHDESPF